MGYLDVSSNTRGFYFRVVQSRSFYDTMWDGLRGGNPRMRNPPSGPALRCDALLHTLHGAGWILRTESDQRLLFGVIPLPVQAPGEAGLVIIVSQSSICPSLARRGRGTSRTTALHSP